MTTPSSPPISLHDVATELGISSVGLSLSDSRVRALAGVPSGPISLHDLLGKSPMSPNIGGDQNDSNMSGSVNFNLRCNPNGGVAPYSYSWAILSQSGGGTVSFNSPSNAQNVTFLLLATSPPMTDIFGTVQCTVTDATARVVASNACNLFYEFI